MKRRDLDGGAALVATAALLVGCGGGGVTYDATLTPITARSSPQCAAFLAGVSAFERRHAPALCSRGVGANWYHATIVAHGNSTEVIACRTRALDADGHTLFAGQLAFTWSGLFGNVGVAPERPVSFDWYAQIGGDVPVAAAVFTYRTDCVPLDHPPV